MPKFLVMAVLAICVMISGETYAKSSGKPGGFNLSKSSAPLAKPSPAPVYIPKAVTPGGQAPLKVTEPAKMVPAPSTTAVPAAKPVAPVQAAPTQPLYNKQVVQQPSTPSGTTVINNYNNGNSGSSGIGNMLVGGAVGYMVGSAMNSPSHAATPQVVPTPQPVVNYGELFGPPIPAKTAPAKSVAEHPFYYWHIANKRECTSDEVKNNPQACERMDGKPPTKGGHTPTNGWAE